MLHYTKIGLLLCVLCAAVCVHAQTHKTGRYRISFTDKNTSPYSIEQPQEFLSEQALARRTQFGIAVSEEDLPVNQAYINGVQSLGAQLCNTSKWFNSAIFLCDSLTDFETIAALPFVKQVEYVARPYQFEVHSATLVQDSAAFSRTFSPQSDSVYGESLRQIQLMNAVQIHRDGFQGQGKTIAVIDGGFLHVDSSWAFRAAWAANRILAVRDFTGSGSDVFTLGSHGLMTFSTIGGYVPGMLLGTAPQAQYVLLRSEESATEYPVEEDNWIAAAEFADSMGVDILSTSLGYTTFDDSTMNHSIAQLYKNEIRITQGANIAAQKGMLVVNSAGNSGDDPWHYISAPADAELGVTVGAVYPSGEITSFSSRGMADAPFVKPEIVAMGAFATVVTAEGLVKSNAFGTSFSCPIAAGIAACLWGEFPSLSAQELKEILNQSGNRSDELTTAYGYGIPDIELARTIVRYYLIAKLFSAVGIETVPGAIQIILNSDSETKIQFLTLEGAPVWSTTFVFGNIEGIVALDGISQIPAGDYVVQTTVGQETVIQKVRVSRTENINE
ncbi:MAG: S8 family serine peptidase [Bacteroidales bacterium]|jgi:hypothetical protein|nr:S8 family serine peptidase [Bacteroidales bacterium]